MQELEEQAAAAGDTILTMVREEAIKRDKIHQLEAGIAELDQELQQASAGFADQRVALTTAAAEIKRMRSRKRVVTSQISANETAVAEIERTSRNLSLSAGSLDKSRRLVVNGKGAARREGKADETNHRWQKHSFGLQEKVKQYNQQLKSLQSRIGRIDRNIYNHRLELDRIDLELKAR